MEGWLKVLIAAGGTAAAAAVVYFLMKDGNKKTGEAGGTRSVGDIGLTKPKAEEITKAQVQEILKEIIKSQDRMKVYLKELTQELMTRPMPFEEVYDRVHQVQPEDPLERIGLSMTDFDMLLDKHQTDPVIREAIGRIMSVPQVTGSASDRVQAISVRQVLEIHAFLLAELQVLVKEYAERAGGGNTFDMKSVTIAAQAIVASKIEEKYGFTSEDLENAVYTYHSKLATDQEFAQLNVKIQEAMGQLMGTPMQSG